MSKKTKRLTSLIGCCVSEIEIRIPMDLRKEEIPEFVAKLSENDQIDLFCMCEALDVHYSNNEDKSSLAIAITMITSFFGDRLNDAAFFAALEDRHLNSSPQRLYLGNKLCLYTKNR